MIAALLIRFIYAFCAFAFTMWASGYYKDKFGEYPGWGTTIVLGVFWPLALMYVLLNAVRIVLVKTGKATPVPEDVR